MNSAMGDINNILNQCFLDRIDALIEIEAYDRAELQKIKDEISQTTELLKDGVELKKEENRLLEEEAKYQTINRLFNDIYSDTKSAQEWINDFVHEPVDSPDFNRGLAMACLLNSYLKRQSNMIILGQQNPDIELRELFLSLREICEFVQIMGSKTMISWDKNCLIPATWGCLGLKFAMDIMQQVAFETKAMLIFLEVDRNEEDDVARTLTVRLMLDTNKEFSSFHKDARIINQDGSKICILRIDGELVK